MRLTRREIARRFFAGESYLDLAFELGRAKGHGRIAELSDVADVEAAIRRGLKDPKWLKPPKKKAKAK